MSDTYLNPVIMDTSDFETYSHVSTMNSATPSGFRALYRPHRTLSQEILNIDDILIRKGYQTSCNTLFIDAGPRVPLSDTPASVVGSKRQPSSAIRIHFGRSTSISGVIYEFPTSYLVPVWYPSPASIFSDSHEIHQ